MMSAYHYVYTDDDYIELPLVDTPKPFLTLNTVPVHTTTESKTESINEDPKSLVTLWLVFGMYVIYLLLFAYNLYKRRHVLCKSTKLLRNRRQYCESLSQISIGPSTDPNGVPDYNQFFQSMPKGRPTAPPMSEISSEFSDQSINQIGTTSTVPMNVVSERSDSMSERSDSMSERSVSVYRSVNSVSGGKSKGCHMM